MTDELAIRLQHIGVDLTQESDRAEAAQEAEREGRLLVTQTAEVSLDLTEHFPPALVAISELRRVGLTLNHRWPWTGRAVHRHDAAADADSLHPGWQFAADASQDVMDTLLLRAFLRNGAAGQPAGAADSQHSQEQGVFISEAALRAEQEKKRRMEDEEQLRLQAAQQQQPPAGGEGRAARRLQAVGAAAQQESWLSLPVLRLSSNELQSYLFRLETRDETVREAVDQHGGLGSVKPTADAALASAAAEQQQQQRQRQQPMEAELRSQSQSQPQQPAGQEAAGEQGDADAQAYADLNAESEQHAAGEEALLLPPATLPFPSPAESTQSSLLASIPSRVEYLLILLVCLLAVAFFAAALGLLPCRAVRRAGGAAGGAAAAGRGSVNGAHGGSGSGSGGSGGGAGGGRPSGLSSLLFALEHHSSLAWHRMRAVMLQARYARAGQRGAGRPQPCCPSAPLSQAPHRSALQPLLAASVCRSRCDCWCCRQCSPEAQQRGETGCSRPAEAQQRGYVHEGENDAQHAGAGCHAASLVLALAARLSAVNTSAIGIDTETGIPVQSLIPSLSSPVVGAGCA